jgi:hypothetical protein
MYWHISSLLHVSGLQGAITQTVTIYSPHPVLLSRRWATTQQAHTELPEDGALMR